MHVQRRRSRRKVESRCADVFTVPHVKRSVCHFTPSLRQMLSRCRRFADRLQCCFVDRPQRPGRQWGLAVGRLVATQISQLGAGLVCGNNSTLFVCLQKYLCPLVSVLNKLSNKFFLFFFFVFALPPDQPNHAEEENCAVIRTESSGRWQNRDCSVALPYVCKKRPNATMDPFTTGMSRCRSWLK